MHTWLLKVVRVKYNIHLWVTDSLLTPGDRLYTTAINDNHPPLPDHPDVAVLVQVFRNFYDTYLQQYSSILKKIWDLKEATFLLRKSNFLE